MYLPAKVDGHRSYGNGGIHFYIISQMNTSEKAELTVSIHCRFSKSGMSIYNSEVPDTAGIKIQEVNEDVGVHFLNLQIV